MSTTANQKFPFSFDDTIDAFIWKSAPDDRYDSTPDVHADRSQYFPGETLGFFTFSNSFGDDEDQIPLDPIISSIWTGLANWNWDTTGVCSLTDNSSAHRSSGGLFSGTGVIEVMRSLQSWSYGIESFGWLFGGNGGTDRSVQLHEDNVTPTYTMIDQAAAAYVPAAENAAEVTTSFQQNVGGYLGTIDTYIRESRADRSYDTKPVVYVDGADKAGGEMQGLIRFSEIFGNGPGQIPLGATITSATLTLVLSNGTRDSVAFHLMAGDWTSQADITWNGFGNGIQTDDVEAFSSPDVVLSRLNKGTELIDVTQSLQAWSDGLANNGWLMTVGGDNGLRFGSSESGTAPILSVTYSIPTDPVPGITVTESDGSTIVTEDGEGDSLSVSLETAPTADVTITVSTSGPDDIGFTPQTLTFTSENWQTPQTIMLSAMDDTITEGTENFTLILTTSSPDTAYDGRTSSVSVAVIDNDAVVQPLSPEVVAIHNTTDYFPDDPSGYGSGDPSGIAYVPELDLLFIVDSEHNESPYFSSVNLFATRLDGTYVDAFSLISYTDEPTGVAYNPFNSLLYITDDDANKIFITDPNDPTVLLGQIDVGALDIQDAEDPVIDPATGHIFLLNGANRELVELSATGDLIERTVLPSEIEDTEGLAYDAAQDVFYISSGSTRGTIFEVDRESNILASTDLLNDYRSPITGGKPKLKGLELAPSSDPNDGDKMSLYAVDYGYDQEPDGRLFEINLHSDWAIA
ncbi:DNRLRE domain-containing protein [Phaeobacter gallaeciensis]|uniref:DNRLRE domain-containing protein n=1 Tax=Phaeobacter gallaeciensis TaxID=60890 RepID=UPI0023808C0B|nr:DNRLRE domain-containing protein [Phaeobacter gallaeciensis]MDE4276508.1 DNRLRE domain-containing protein [Phaeobacter gallaeciensis]MDE4301751.1 DNRLRE domain-containing protein [Phaeobacter gallaeciensis]MDE5186904.1 DNRLRE domain-containing protein [Phaeobacter gallaeciensis]